MPESAFQWNGERREISGATRALFYSLLNNTSSDLALLPPTAHGSLCDSCSQIQFDTLFCTDTGSSFEIGTFSEIENRRDCAFCSFVKNVCLVAFPWHWIRRFQGLPKRFKILGGPVAWRYCIPDINPSRHVSAETTDPGLISPCAALQAPRFIDQDENEEYDEGFLSGWVLSCEASPEAPVMLSARLRSKREVINGQLDINLIKSWIAACTTHDELCHQKLSTPELHTYVRPKFIDVMTETIVPGENVTDYIALSYVWGSEKPEQGCRHDETRGGGLVISTVPTQEGNYKIRNSRHLVFKSPCQVVRDAMKLVKDIGFRYLWVDEYCIGLEPRQREIHIRNMDRIYEGALLTICALSGEHKHLGLPGISSPCQAFPQPYVDLGSKRIIATGLPGFLRDVYHSPWNQRAWTLQEASLSRRLLCFTESQIFWVCRQQMFHDAINCLDLGASGRMSMNPPKSFMYFPFHLDEFGGRFDMPAFRNILISYTRRQLTKESDALAAISGLLARIAKMTGEEFCLGHPKGDLIRSLMWKTESVGKRTCHRRKGFPSWSWLGWGGDITLAMWREDCLDISQPGIFLIDIDKVESNRHYVMEKRIATVVDYPEEKTGGSFLKVFTQVTRLKAAKVLHKGQKFENTNCDGTQTAEADIWCLDIPHSHDLPCVHEGIGWVFCSSGCFAIDPKISARWEQVRAEGPFRIMEFMLLVHWQEYMKGHDFSWRTLESSHLFAGSSRTEVGDLVLALLILRDQDGKAERVALVPIPYESWIAASPEEMLVELA